MSLISTAIPNLLSGVSQQPSAMRYPSQADEQINAYPSVIDGLIKRPPTEHVKQLISGNASTVGNCLCHLINRDTTERYAVVLRNGAIQVTSLTSPSTAITVTNTNGTGYINTSNPQTDLKALTVGDYTFILNTTKVPAMLSGAGNLSPSQAPQCLITVVAGAYSSTYKITFYGTDFSVTTSGTNADQVQTDWIATQLAAALTHASTGLNATSRGGFTDWSVSRTNSTIKVTRSGGGAFTYPTLSDGRSNTLTTLVTDQASKVSDLPLVAPDGYIVKVVGDSESGYDDYFLKFKANTSGAFGQGVWEETQGPGLTYKLDPDTMPYVLVRTNSTNFEFKRGSWDTRIVGDADTSPIPSFVGRAIKDIFFFRNRLGVIAQDKIILSEAGSYFNFWRTSVLQVLDGDPIDLGVASPKVAALNSALPFAEQLLLFGDQTQFILGSANDLLTPKTATITQTTDFRSLASVRPVSNGRLIFFAEGRGDYSGIREYFQVATNSNNIFDAQNITAQVPAYIKGSVVELDATTHDDLLIVRTDNSPDTIYCYKYLNNGNERVQSAWFKFNFPGSTIRGMGWIDTTLYLFNQRSDALYLEKMVVEPGRKDSGLDFVVTLDRRVTEASVTAAYDATTAQTTFTGLPYTVRAGATMQVVSRANTPTVGVFPIGTIATPVSASGTTIVVSGNWTGKSVYIGEQYDMTYRTSTCYIRQGQTNTIIPQGRFQLGYGTLVYTGSSNFTVSVTPRYRDTYTYSFTGNILGSNATIGSIGVWSGNFRFPIFAKNDEVTISISNDSPLPCGLTSLDYEGTFNTRSRRV